MRKMCFYKYIKINENNDFTEDHFKTILASFLTILKTEEEIKCNIVVNDINKIKCCKHKSNRIEFLV